MNSTLYTRLAVGVAFTLSWLYLSALFLVGEPGLPLGIGASAWYLGAIAALWLGFFFAGLVLRRRLFAMSRLTNISLMTTTIVVCMLVLDTAYSMYLTSNVPTVGTEDTRQFDENTWIGELHPALYYPSERNFRLHKPNVTVSGSAYGNFYRHSMQRSPTLVNSVLEKNTTTVNINEFGFRESTPIQNARIFAIGDSLTFGWGVNESESWPGQLEGLLGQPVYNLGIYDSNPKQALELIRHILREQGENVQIRELLWMIYESNDLDGSYADIHEVRAHSAENAKTGMTLVGLIRSLPRVIRRQSVIEKIRTGSISWKGLDTQQLNSTYFVDGVSLVHPLFYSQRFGPRLFYGPYVQRAGEPESSTFEHPNKERLEAVFHDMASLAKEFGFNVAVIVAPGASRAYGRYFDDFPEVSSTPHFIDFLIGLAHSAGFEAVDLYDLMQPYAASELLYFRDDDHFNRRGNTLVAELIHKELFASQHP